MIRGTTIGLGGRININPLCFVRDHWVKRNRPHFFFPSPLASRTHGPACGGAPASGDWGDDFLLSRDAGFGKFFRRFTIRTFEIWVFSRKSYRFRNERVCVDFLVVLRHYFFELIRSCRTRRQFLVRPKNFKIPNHIVLHVYSCDFVQPLSNSSAFWKT